MGELSVNPDTMRSLEAKIRCRVRFVNNTRRKVNIIWLDYTGGEVSYGVLDGDQSPSLKVWTFLSHPWVAVDENNKNRLWLNSEDVFYPSPPEYVHIRRGNRVGRVPKSRDVLIAEPVYNTKSLEELCCQVFSKTIKLEAIDELPVPKFVKDEVLRHLESPSN